ncbi:hypothetical protein QU24_26795 [Pantoea rodasii]|uniref:Uncharacterized protein n=1 Tax=Pantoea rodasii TaxID=1076549 RepID=A0A0B1R1I5_9GAMM|nr:hypothetical protein QU24_26795 [Pantoea rodasii]
MRFNSAVLFATTIGAPELIFIAKILFIYSRFNRKTTFQHLYCHAAADVTLFIFNVMEFLIAMEKTYRF